MNNSGNILVITYWSWNDALIQANTLPYLRIIRNMIGPGRKIILVTLEKTKNTKQNLIQREEGIFQLELNYTPFGGKAALRWLNYLFVLRKIVRREKIETIHGWCTPAGAIAYFLSKMTRKKLVIDSYEPHAEAMVENGSWQKSGIAFRFLFRMEKKMSHHASFLIACTEGMKAYAMEKYGKSSENMLVKPACVDLDHFHPDLSPENIRSGLSLPVDKSIGLYVGKFGGIYLDDEIYRFFRECFTVFGDHLIFVVLTNESKEKIEEQCLRYALPKEKIISLFVPHQDVPKYMQAADFALTPVKSVPSKRYCTPIKDGEYWASGLPVVITRNISDDSEIIANENAGVVLENLSDSALRRAARQMKLLLENETAANRKTRIRKIAERYRNFSIAHEVYKKIYGN